MQLLGTHCPPHRDCSNVYAVSLWLRTVGVSVATFVPLKRNGSFSVREDHLLIQNTYPAFQINHRTPPPRGLWWPLSSQHADSVMYVLSTCSIGSAVFMVEWGAQYNKMWSNSNDVCLSSEDDTCIMITMSVKRGLVCERGKSSCWALSNGKILGEVSMTKPGTTVFPRK